VQNLDHDGLRDAVPCFNRSAPGSFKKIKRAASFEHRNILLMFSMV
jgi:hypothetical protein